MSEFYPPQVEEAANAVLSGFDMRDKSSPNGMELKMFFYKGYMGLPSHTQFVESGVKDAAHVSQTGRLEPLRSVYAVNRSSVHCEHVLGDLPSTERIHVLFNCAKKHCITHDGHVDAVGEAEYKEALAKIKAAMKTEHFRLERLNDINEVVLEAINTNRSTNATQRITGVTPTAAVLGMVPYGKLKIDPHLPLIILELQARQVSEEEIIKLKGIRKMSAKLKQLERGRVKTATMESTDEEKKQALETADKAFTPLSGIIFEYD